MPKPGEWAVLNDENFSTYIYILNVVVGKVGPSSIVIEIDHFCLEY